LRFFCAKNRKTATLPSAHPSHTLCIMHELRAERRGLRATISEKTVTIHQLAPADAQRSRAPLAKALYR
jgi:hypothetical protein